MRWNEITTLNSFILGDREVKVFFCRIIAFTFWKEEIWGSLLAQSAFWYLLEISSSICKVSLFIILWIQLEQGKELTNEAKWMHTYTSACSSTSLPSDLVLEFVEKMETETETKTMGEGDKMEMEKEEQVETEADRHIDTGMFQLLRTVFPQHIVTQVDYSIIY